MRKGNHKTDRAKLPNESFKVNYFAVKEFAARYRAHIVNYGEKPK